MNTATKRSFSFLPYIPFLLLEWAILAVYLGNTFFKPKLLQENFKHQIVIVLLIWLISAVIAKFYHYDRNLTYTKQLQRFLLFSSIWVLMYILVELFSTSLFVVNQSTVIGFLLIVFFSKAISISILFKLRKTSLAYQHNILVYNLGSAKSFISDVILLKRTGYNIYKAEKGLFDKKSIDLLKSTIHKEKIKTIFIPIEVALKKSSEHILDLSWNKEVKIKLVANYNAPIVGKGARFFGLTQVLKHRISPLDIRLRRIQKRAFDILFSFLVIVSVLLWVIPIVGLCILLDTKGPLFFVQHRPGKSGKLFPCFKLRSMTVNSSTEKSALRDDARVTSVGKIIRKTSIDELPQFFNVFFGHMSIVGPRPNLISQNEYYKEMFKEYPKRMYLKPGITGLAQVSGARGGIENDLEMKHRIKYDIFYIRNWSFALDIKIIISTVINVIKGEDKAY